MTEFKIYKKQVKEIITNFKLEFLPYLYQNYGLTINIQNGVSLEQLYLDIENILNNWDGNWHKLLKLLNSIDNLHSDIYKVSNDFANYIPDLLYKNLLYCFVNENFFNKEVETYFLNFLQFFINLQNNINKYGYENFLD